MVDVEIDRHERIAKLKTDKRKVVYTVSLAVSRHPMFVFSCDSGTIPEELRGTYTTLDRAIKAFEGFDRTAKKSSIVRRDERQSAKEAKRAKLHPTDE